MGQPQIWHPSTSIVADSGSFNIVNSEVFVSAHSEIDVQQPGAAEPTIIPFHEAVFEFSGGRWLPRDNPGHGFQMPRMCDLYDQVNWDLSGQPVDRSLLPAGAKVKDILPLGRSNDRAVVFATPPRDEFPLPGTYPLWLLAGDLTSHSTARPRPIDLGNDGMYCGSVVGNGAGVKILGIFRYLPSAVHQMANLQLFWAPAENPQPKPRRPRR